MGYLLPIIHYAGQNYHYRLLKSKNSPHKITGAYKIVFYQIGAQEDEKSNSYSEIPAQNRRKKIINKERDTIKIKHPEGKGEHIHVRI